MHITAQESHHISVLAGQGEIIKLRAAVQSLAERENTSTAEVLLACKDDFHQTAAHIAAKSGQTRTICPPFARPLDNTDKQSRLDSDPG